MNTKKSNTLVTIPATKPESCNPMTGEEYKTNLRLRRKYPEKEICDAYERLGTVKEVAREFKLDKETVRKILLRNRGYPQLVVENINVMYIIYSIYS